MVKIKFKGEELTVINNGRYQDGSIKLSLVDQEGFPYMTPSVFVEGIPIVHLNQTVIKNYSENTGIYEALAEQGIVAKVNANFKIPINDFGAEVCLTYIINEELLGIDF